MVFIVPKLLLLKVLRPQPDNFEEADTVFSTYNLKDESELKWTPRIFKLGFTSITSPFGPR